MRSCRADRVLDSAAAHDRLQHRMAGHNRQIWLHHLIQMHAPAYGIGLVSSVSAPKLSERNPRLEWHGLQWMRSGFSMYHRDDPAFDLHQQHALESCARTNPHGLVEFTERTRRREGPSRDL